MVVCLFLNLESLAKMTAIAAFKMITLRSERLVRIVLTMN